MNMKLDSTVSSKKLISKTAWQLAKFYEGNIFPPVSPGESFKDPKLSS